MTAALLAVLPLQLVCHLIVPGVSRVNIANFAVDRKSVQIQPTKLPNGATAVPLGSLPLHVVCQLLVTSNPGVTENGTLVDSETTTPTTPVTFIPVDSEATTPTTPVTLPEGYVAFPEDNAAYKIFREKVEWDEARERCNSDGARLAVADTADKIQHIRSLDTREDGWIHVGIHKSDTTNEWGGVDNGLPLSSLPWAAEYSLPGSCADIVVSLYEEILPSATIMENLEILIPVEVVVVPDVQMPSIFRNGYMHE